MREDMRKYVKISLILAIAFVSIVWQASAQVWINTNVASTSGPLPGASPSALSPNASILYFPSILRLMTNIYLHDDSTNSLSIRLMSFSSWTNYATFSADTNEPAAICDIGGIGGVGGRLGIYDGSSAEIYRLSASDAVVYGTWGTNAVNGLWSYPSAPYDYTSQPTWLGVVNDSEADRIAALAEEISASTWSEYPATNEILITENKIYPQYSQTIKFKSTFGGDAFTNTFFAMKNGLYYYRLGYEGQPSKILRESDLGSLTNSIVINSISNFSADSNGTVRQRRSIRIAFDGSSNDFAVAVSVNGTTNFADDNGIISIDGIGGAEENGWTNLAFSGSGNAITGAMADATTLTLQRGAIENGGGTNIAPSGGAEGFPLFYAWSTNITLVAGTNVFDQAILSIDGPTVLYPPTKSSASNGAAILLAIPAISTNSFTFATNSAAGTAYFAGATPILSTNAFTYVRVWSPSGMATTNARAMKMYW